MVGSQVVWKQELEHPLVLWLSCLSVLIPALTPSLSPFSFPSLSSRFMDPCSVIFAIYSLLRISQFKWLHQGQMIGLSSQLQILKRENVIAPFFSFLKV